MNEKTEKALGIIQVWSFIPDGWKVPLGFDVLVGQAKEALAVLKSAVEERDALKHNLEMELERCSSYAEEFRKMEKERDALRTKNLDCKSKYRLLAAIYEKAEAEVERAERVNAIAVETIAGLTARAEKAEAEVGIIRAHLAKALAENHAVEVETLKAEVERITKLYAELVADYSKEIARAEKAEADIKERISNQNRSNEEIGRLQAEVEKLRVDVRSSLLRDRAEAAEDRVQELEAEAERLERENAILSQSEGQAILEANLAVEHFEKAEAELAAANWIVQQFLPKAEDRAKMVALYLKAKGAKP